MPCGARTRSMRESCPSGSCGTARAADLRTGCRMRRSSITPYHIPRARTCAHIARASLRARPRAHAHAIRSDKCVQCSEGAVRTPRPKRACRFLGDLGSASASASMTGQRGFAWVGTHTTMSGSGADRAGSDRTWGAVRRQSYRTAAKAAWKRLQCAPNEPHALRLQSAAGSVKRACRNGRTVHTGADGVVLQYAWRGCRPGEPPPPLVLLSHTASAFSRTSLLIVAKSSCRHRALGSP